MKIGELARRSGLSAHTIRYYERIGLLPYADRDGSRQRDYDASILTWIEFLSRLKTTGMPIREMLRYAALRAAGPATGSERQHLLEAHRETVRARIAEWQACLTVLDAKIAGYADAETRIDDHAASLHSGRPQPERPLPGRPASGRLPSSGTRKPARSRSARAG
ncbi:MerR family transcriptional regulator [Prosthecomicrobium hirschii]|uniref:MerR family transcriptional regulator n=1 Tax=Prosthecodimorpha hirschii TaxID=665126 RepID=UPI00112DBA3E|nr:MerR family transcriptional regulator [Prosthecomicrobium hirschii]TPQ52951.1 MerR family transcriptional regulator [Prosthecomicrobium hirschii]